MTAFKLRLPQELIFHSDQSFNYTFETFKMCLKDLIVKQYFSNPGNPFNNPVMELFLKSSKVEKLYHKVFRSKKRI